MKKTLITLVVTLPIIVLTPIIPWAYLSLKKDFTVSKISGSLIKGYNFYNLTYKNIIVENLYVYLDKKIIAKNLKYQLLNIDNIYIKKNNNNYNISGKIQDHYITGNLDKNYNATAYILKKNRKIQKIELNTLKQHFKFVSKGVFGNYALDYDLASDDLIWNVKDFRLNSFTNIDQIKKINSSGKINFNDDITVTGYIEDANKNKLLLTIDKNKINLHINLKNAIVLDHISGNISVDRNNQQISTNLETQIKNEAITIKSKNNQGTVSFEKGQKICFKLNTNNLKISDLTKYEYIFQRIKNRFSSIYNPPKKSVSTKKILSFYGNIPNAMLSDRFKNDLSIKGSISANATSPYNATLSLLVNNTKYKIHGNEIIIESAKFNTTAEQSELNINGQIKNKPFQIKAIKKIALNIDIRGTEIPLPISHSTSLIVSPNLKLKQLGDIYYVTGETKVLGGEIYSRKHDSVIDMPENIIILGENKKTSLLDNLLENLSGSINLITEKPVYLRNIAGLRGKISGQLLLKLQKNSKPKYDGELILSNGSYLRSKHIKVAYAIAKYENNLIDNPTLDIRLTRAISQPKFELLKMGNINNDEHVGVDISGPASLPNIKTFSTNPNTSKLQIISALETGSKYGINPEQGILSLFSIVNDTNNESAMERIQEALALDELYFMTNSSSTENNLINPNLGESSIVFSKNIFENLKASFISSLHKKDYLITASYSIGPNINTTIYSSHSSRPNLSSNLDNYGINILWHLYN